jgi:hypothetical protein
VLVATRTRIAAFGSAAALVLAGALCAALVRGGTGQVIGLALIGTGAVLVTGLVFLEVGLSEDRQRERDAARAKRGLRQRSAKRSDRPRLGQSTGHRRRLPHGER